VVVALLSGAGTELGLAVAATGADRALARDVVDTWLGVVGPRTVLLASPRPFCAGVERAIVVFSAHGVAPSVRKEAHRRGMAVIDATCPLVTKVHGEARRFARNSASPAS
jgi:hypothetical protein